MKRFITIYCAMILSAQSASASDTSGALMVLPIAGGVIGLVVGAMICNALCSKKSRKRAVWFSLPAFALAGFGLSVAAIVMLMSNFEDKVVCSFGRYDHSRGGMPVIAVPRSFSATELKQFYGLLTNRENPVLASHEFAVALIHQSNGIDRVSLNVYPNLEIPTEYDRISDEVQRQMDVVLQRFGQGADTRK